MTADASAPAAPDARTDERDAWRARFDTVRDGSLRLAAPLSA